MNSSRTRFQEDTGWTGFRERTQHLVLWVVDYRVDRRRGKGQVRYQEVLMKEISS